MICLGWLAYQCSLGMSSMLLITPLWGHCMWRANSPHTDYAKNKKLCLLDKDNQGAWAGTWYHPHTFHGWVRSRGTGGTTGISQSVCCCCPRISSTSFAYPCKPDFVNLIGKIISVLQSLHCVQGLEFNLRMFREHFLLSAAYREVSYHTEHSLTTKAEQSSLHITATSAFSLSWETWYLVLAL